MKRARAEPWLIYDHIDLPPIAPVITRVELLAGRGACWRTHYRAETPADMPYGPPFGPRMQALHLRFTQAIALKRLAAVFADVFGVELSEGALVNMMDCSERGHQVCLAHLDRDLQYAVDCGESVYAPKLRTFRKIIGGFRTEKGARLCALCGAH